MLISTEIGSIKEFGTNREILTMLKQAGFEAYDFSAMMRRSESYLFCDDYLEQAKELRRFADELGLVCNQAHAPFPVKYPENPYYAAYLMENLARQSGRTFSAERAKEEYEAIMPRLVERAVEISGVLGAKNIVVHPVNNYTAEQNAEYYETLVPFAKRAGVKIAVENMFNWKDGSPHATDAACSNHEDFVKHLSLLDEQVFVACLDIGHSEMEGLRTSAVEMIKALGSRLKCLHIHDNDKKHDLHRLACTNQIDYDAVCAALKEVGYDGDITMEADCFANRFDTAFYPKAMRFMYEIGDYLRGKIL